MARRLMSSLRRMAKRFFSSSRKSSPTKQKLHWRRMECEHLEQRELLAITGTAGDDYITLQRVMTYAVNQPPRLSVNWARYAKPAGSLPNWTPTPGVTASTSGTDVLGDPNNAASFSPLFLAGGGGLNDTFMFDLTTQTVTTYSVTEPNPGGGERTTTVTTYDFQTYDNAVAQMLGRATSKYGTTQSLQVFTTAGGTRQAIDAFVPVYFDNDSVQITFDFSRGMMLPPDAPTRVSATDSSTANVVVTWDAMPRATSYDVYRSTDASPNFATRVATVTNPTYTDGAATLGRVYYYWVKAKNTTGSSGFSNYDTGGRGVAQVVSLAPSGVFATTDAASNQVRVFWNAVGCATSYEIIRNTTNSPILVADGGTAVSVGTTAQLFFDDNTAVNGTSYYYWVRALNVDAVAPGPVSTSVVRGRAAAVPALPGTPDPVMATYNEFSDRVRVTWEYVADALQYNVYRNTTNSFTGAVLLAAGLNGATYDNFTATTGVKYWYFVTAQNTAGTGSPSAGALGRRLAYSPLTDRNSLAQFVGTKDPGLATNLTPARLYYAPNVSLGVIATQIDLLAPIVLHPLGTTAGNPDFPYGGGTLSLTTRAETPFIDRTLPAATIDWDATGGMIRDQYTATGNFSRTFYNMQDPYVMTINGQSAILAAEGSVGAAGAPVKTKVAKLESLATGGDITVRNMGSLTLADVDGLANPDSQDTGTTYYHPAKTAVSARVGDISITTIPIPQPNPDTNPPKAKIASTFQVIDKVHAGGGGNILLGNATNNTGRDNFLSQALIYADGGDGNITINAGYDLLVGFSNTRAPQIDTSVAPNVWRTLPEISTVGVGGITLSAVGAVQLTDNAVVQSADGDIVITTDDDGLGGGGSNLQVFEMQPTAVIRAAAINVLTGAFLSFQQGRISITSDGDATISTLQNANGGADAVTVVSASGGIINGLDVGSTDVNISAIPFTNPTEPCGITLASALGIGDAVALRISAGTLSAANADASRARNIRLIETDGVNVLGLSNILTDLTRIDNDPTTGLIDLTAAGDINILASGSGVTAVDGNISIEATVSLGGVPSIRVDQPVATTGTGQVLIRAGDSVLFGVGSEVQTLTIAGSVTGGNFRLIYGGNLISGPIVWSASTATLLANIQAQLNIMFGAGNAVAADDGGGGISITFQGALTHANLQQLTVNPANLIGGSATITTLTNGGGNTVQTVVATGAGTMTFSYTAPDGVVTAAASPLDWPPTAATLLDHLNTIPALNGNVAVIGADGGDFTVVFTGQLHGTSVAALTAATNSGNAAATITVATAGGYISSGSGGISVIANTGAGAGGGGITITMTGEMKFDGGSGPILLQTSATTGGGAVTGGDLSVGQLTTTNAGADAVTLNSGGSVVAAALGALDNFHVNAPAGGLTVAAQSGVGWHFGSEVQTLTFDSTVASGDFALGYGATITTSPIVWSSNIVELTTRIQQAVDSIFGAGNALVEYTAGYYSIYFQAGLSNANLQQLTVVSNLVGGTVHAATLKNGGGNTIQTLELSNDDGSLTLSYLRPGVGFISAAAPLVVTLPAAPTANAVRAHLSTIPDLSGNVTVFGTAEGGFTIVFNGDLQFTAVSPLISVTNSGVVTATILAADSGAQPLRTHVQVVDGQNAGAARAGAQNSIGILQTGAVAINRLSNALADDNSGVTGSITLETIPDGVAPASIMVRSSGLGGMGVEAMDGDVSLTAAGASADVIIQAPVATSSAGQVLIVADDSVRIDVGGGVNATGTAPVVVRANNANRVGGTSVDGDSDNGIAMTSIGTETVQLTFDKSIAGGSFTLTYAAKDAPANAATLTTAPIYWNANTGVVQSNIQNALTALFGVGNVSVLADPVAATTQSFTITFVGALVNANLEPLTIDSQNNKLVGGRVLLATLQDGAGNGSQVIDFRNPAIVGTTNTYRLTLQYNAAIGQTPLLFSDPAAITPAQVLTSLQSIPGLNGNVAVVGPTGGPFTVVFRNGMSRKNIARLTASATIDGVDQADVPFSIIRYHDGIPALAAETSPYIDAGAGTVLLEALGGAAGDVRVTNVQTQNDTDSAVIVNAARGVVDGSRTSTAIAAPLGGLAIVAVEGVGSAWPLKTQVDRLNVVNANIVAPYNIQISEVDGVTITRLLNSVSGDANADTGSIVLTAGLPAYVAPMIVLVDDAGAGVHTTDGNVTIRAQGVNANIVVAQEIATDDRGGVTIAADDSVTIPASGAVRLGGVGRVTISASSRAAAGDLGGTLTIDGGATIDAGYGTIALSTSATQGADVTLSGLLTAFAGADETQLLTFIANTASGIADGSLFTFSYGNLVGPPIQYNNVPSILIGNISTALESMFGRGNTRVSLVSSVEAASPALIKPLAAAIVSVAFSGELASANLEQLTVQSALSGGTVAIATQQHGSGNAMQKLSATAGGGVGTVRLSFNGQSVAAGSELIYSGPAVPTPADVEASLNTIPALSGNVAVIGANGGPYTIIFRNALAHTNVSALTAATTGAASAAVSVASEANTTAAVTVNSSGAVRKAIASVDEAQSLTLDGTITSGAFALNYGPNFTTNLIDWNADPDVIAGDLQTELEGLFGIGNVVAAVASSSASGTVFSISFLNAFESVNLPQPTVVQSTLVGGGAAASTRQNGSNELQTLSLSGPDSSAFEVGYLAQWGAAPLTFVAGASPTAADLQAHLETLPDFAGNVRVLGDPGGPLLVIFENGLAHTNLMPLTVRSTAGVVGLVDVQAVSDVNAPGGMLVINSKSGVGELAPLGTSVSALSVLNGGGEIASDVEIHQMGPVGLLNLQNYSPADDDAATGAINVRVNGTINVVPNGTGVGNSDGNITLRAAGPNSDIIVQNQIVAGRHGQIYLVAEDSLVFLSGSSARASTPEGIALEANASDVAGNDGNMINMAAGAIVDAGSGVLTVYNVGKNAGLVVLGSLSSSNAIDIHADKSVTSAANMPAGASNAIAPELSITAITGIGAANLSLVVDARAVTALAASGGVYLSNRGAMTIGQLGGPAGIQAGAGDINVTATGPLTVMSGVAGSNNITLGANESTLHSVFGYGAPMTGEIPLMGDWNGDGVITAGVFRPGESVFYLRNSNDTGNADIAFGYGVPGSNWIPLVGDWNADGIDTVGFYDPATSQFYLRNTNDTGIADYAFGYGAPTAGWEPLAGDWNGDGATTIGLFDRSASFFYLTDALVTGIAEYAFGYGVPGSKWKPVIGDWDGQDGASIGFYDPDSALFMLRNTLLTGVAEDNLVFGPAGANWTPFAGDFSNQGFATVGLFDPNTSRFHLTPGDDVTVYDGTLVATTNGSIVLAGGDGVNVGIGAQVRATAGITLNIGNNDSDGFGMGNINGAMLAPLPVLITGGVGNDSLIVNLSYATQPPGGFNFAGSDGYDTLFISGTLDADTILVDDNSGDLRWQGKAFGFYTQTEELQFYTLGGDDLVNVKTRTDLATRVRVDGGADSGNLNQARDAVKLVGTAGSDNIVVGAFGSGDQYWINHAETLQIMGGDGADTLINNTATPAVLNGGAGNDVLLGGHAQGPLNPNDPLSVKLGDSLFGGDGVDSLTGREGESYLFGDHDFLIRDALNRPVASNPAANDLLLTSLGSRDTMVALLLDDVDSAVNTGDTVVGPTGILLPPLANFKLATTANINAALDGALTRPWAKPLAGPSS